MAASGSSAKDGGVSESTQRSGAGKDGAGEEGNKTKEPRQFVIESQPPVDKRRCPTCFVVFSNQSNAKRHAKNCTGPTLKKCGRPVGFKPSADTKQSKKWKCDCCGKEYVRWYLKKHMEESCPNPNAQFELQRMMAIVADAEEEARMVSLECERLIKQAHEEAARILGEVPSESNDERTRNTDVGSTNDVHQEDLSEEEG
ncbi:hypothetical protein GUITHDRAFT_111044 [Guillardia theta CCMP2712]|uniref:C2H2-type domain-containing protein n=2 Tax=Guillardia theta TaxID=55529 RepID=L1J394_GUITC|nr:hypothetical protein GUITHDRAFT_111044 [Guillardia theta CCMP2712]EKX42998.1 hypothetical protein GUITHDRAFT_111044 [Guillardia theta CCMP2712]|eukprot:XP_005829978.1 hypothetical protein GUITHDRAFT_111044 [Guillardia theta CCMP2712]